MTGGPILRLGKKKPVTLVATVVRRKVIVNPAGTREPSRANRQTTPVAIPIRLNTTCRVVKVDSDRPSIMTAPPKEPLPWLSRIDATPSEFPQAGVAGAGNFVGWACVAGRSLLAPRSEEHTS